MYICRYVYGNKNVFAKKKTRKKNKKKQEKDNKLTCIILCTAVHASYCRKVHFRMHLSGNELE